MGKHGKTRISTEVLYGYRDVGSVFVDRSLPEQSKQS